MGLLKDPIFMSTCNLPQPSLGNTLEADSLTADPFLCFTALHNILALCHSSTPRVEVMESSSIYCPDVKDSVHLAQNCKSWITGGDQDQNKRDCEMAAKVVWAAQFVGEEVRCEKGDTARVLIKLVLDTARALARVKRDVEGVDKKVEQSAKGAEENPIESSDTEVPAVPEVPEAVEVVENSIQPNEDIAKTAELVIDPLVDSKASNEQTDKIAENAEVGGEETVANPEEISNPPGAVPPDDENIAPDEIKNEIPEPELQGQNGENVEGTKEQQQGDDKEGQEKVDSEPIVGESPPVENAPNEANAVKQVGTYEKNVMPGPDAAPATSNFFAYFIVLCVVTIVGYLVFHNKKKVGSVLVR